jgi:hypothetical protein
MEEEIMDWHKLALQVKPNAPARSYWWSHRRKISYDMPQSIYKGAVIEGCKLRSNYTTGGSNALRRLRDIRTPDYGIPKMWLKFYLVMSNMRWERRP